MGAKNCIWLGLLSLILIVPLVYFFLIRSPSSSTPVGDSVPNHQTGPTQFPVVDTVPNPQTGPTQNVVRWFNVTVSGAGSGEFSTVSDAIRAAPSLSSARFIIRVRQGVYNEVVVVPHDKMNIVLVGDGADVTRITAGRSEPKFPTSDTATFSVLGDGFIAQGITFENTATSTDNSNQAVALLCSANYTIFHKCKFLGYHDTLYAKEGFHFYRDCDIYGTVDFVFGFAKAVFQNCNLYARLSSYQTVTYIAQGRSSPSMDSGFTFQGCQFTVSPEVGPAGVSLTGYLGRPWFPYSTVMVMESYLDTVVNPVGWVEWPDSTVDHVTYLEFRNRGPGSNTSNRVKWSGYKLVQDENEAVQYTPSRMIQGDEWIPQTGVPYNSGFMFTS